ncbi:MAG: hypothetical protein ACMG57_04460 [Candidatus Dojkabacteria bacterium]
MATNQVRHYDLLDEAKVIQIEDDIFDYLEEDSRLIQIFGINKYVLNLTNFQKMMLRFILMVKVKLDKDFLISISCNQTNPIYHLNNIKEVPKTLMDALASIPKDPIIINYYDKEYDELWSLLSSLAGHSNTIVLKESREDQIKYIEESLLETIKVKKIDDSWEVVIKNEPKVQLTAQEVNRMTSFNLLPIFMQNMLDDYPLVYGARFKAFPFLTLSKDEFSGIIKNIYGVLFLEEQ